MIIRPQTDNFIEFVTNSMVCDSGIEYLNLNNTGDFALFKIFFAE